MRFVGHFEECAMCVKITDYLHKYEVRAGGIGGAGRAAAPPDFDRIS